jgi:hypothetical protein
VKKAGRKPRLFHSARRFGLGMGLPEWLNRGMENTAKKFRSPKSILLLFCAVLALGLGGCSAFLYDYPAVARDFDSPTPFPPLKPGEVYFFLSKDAFPQDLQSVPVCTLFSAQNSQWTRKKLIEEFQEKAAEVGANAVVFNHIDTGKLDYGFLYYTGYATVYRLFKQSPSEDVDLSATDYGTQDPDLGKVK